MFKKLAVLFLTLISVTAKAENEYYGVNFSRLDYSETGVVDDASLSTIDLRLGKPFNEHIAAELRGSFGITDEEVDVDGVDVNVELDYSYGAFLRAGLPVNDMFYPYLLGGISELKITTSLDNRSVSRSDTSWALGLGVVVNINDNTSINVEYIDYSNDENGEMEGVSIGLIGKF